METQRNFASIAADVRAAQSGSSDAMNRILTDVQDMVYYNCLRMLRNEPDALDASQEILITVYRKLGTLSDPAAYVGWVKRITANHCKNRLCKVNKEFLLSENEDGEDPFASFEDTDEQRIPDKAIDNAETRRMIVELIDRLPDEQRMCVILYYYDEMKTREIAQALGVSEGTVKSRLNYARKSIREGVQAYEKQGIKLYGLSPLPFLGYFLRASGKTVSAPFAIQMSVPCAAGTAAGTGAAASGTGAGAAAAAAPAKSTGLGAFLATTAGKVTAGIAAAAVLGGAVAGTAALVNASSHRTQPEPAPTAYVQQQDEDPYAGLFATSKPVEEQTLPSDVWVELLCSYQNPEISYEDSVSRTLFTCDLDGDGAAEQISCRISGDWDDRRLTVTAGSESITVPTESWIMDVESAMVVDLDPNSPSRNLIINLAGEFNFETASCALQSENGRLVMTGTDSRFFWYDGKLYLEPPYNDVLRSHDPGCVGVSGDSLTPDSEWYTWNDAYVAYYRERYRAAGGYFTPCELHVIRDLPCTIDGVNTVIPAGSRVTIYGDHMTEPLAAVRTADGRIAVIRVEPCDSDDWENWCPYTINGVPQDDYFEPDAENGDYWE